MDTERLRITLGSYAIRIRAKVRTAAQLLGVGLVLWGMFNMLAAPLFGIESFAPYRIFGVVAAGEDGVYYIGDALVMCAGAILAWFV
jgi:hypothetical protein